MKRKKNQTKKKRQKRKIGQIGGNHLIEYIKTKNSIKAIEEIHKNKYEVLKYDINNRDALYYASKYNLTNVIEEIEKAKKEIEDENYLKKITKTKTKILSQPDNIEYLNHEVILSEKTGFYPYLNTYINIDEWIKETFDNIVIIYDSNNICLKKSYFIDVSIDNLILECVYKNNTLLLKQIINKDDYINLKRYGFNNNIITHYNSFIHFLKNSSEQIFHLISYL
jgi:hypothetical protein